MQYPKWLRFPVLLLAVCCVWASCQKGDYQNAEFADHTAEFAFPLFTTTLELQDLMGKILNDSLSGDTIVVNPDNTMTLYYSGDVAEKKATDIFTFFKNGLIPIADTFYKAPFEAPAGVTVRRADLKSGTITISVYNNLTEPISGTFYIPQMRKDGKVFSYPFVAQPNPTLPWFSLPIDLTGQILESDSNKLEFRYEAYLPDGTRIKVPDYTGGALPGMIVSFQNLEFSYLEGYWGKSSYPLTRDEIEIDINQTSLNSNVHIVDPKVTMTVFNSWGFPTRGVVKYLSFVGQDGKEYQLESAVLANDSVDFNYPQYILGEVGQTKQTQYFFNSKNSNIDDIFNAQPVRLIYEVEGVSNALEDETIIGFLTDSSKISLRISVEMVLEGSAKDFSAEQFMDLNFGEYNDIDTTNIESVEFKLVTENETPIGTALQIYFLDEAQNRFDSLFVGAPQFIMEGAPVDGNGVVTDMKRTETLIPMSSARFDRVRKAKQAYLKTAFTTTGGGLTPVKLLATQKAKIKMGLKVKTKY